MALRAFDKETHQSTEDVSTYPTIPLLQGEIFVKGVRDKLTQVRNNYVLFLSNNKCNIAETFLYYKKDVHFTTGEPKKLTTESSSEAKIEFPIVGIGASAGGLDPIRELLEALPVDTGMSFVVIQHLATGTGEYAT